MPKIKIVEIDKTGTLGEPTISNTVYIPGPTQDGQEPFAPVLCSSVEELNKLVEDKKMLRDSTSHRLATHLINLGMKVLYEGIGPAQNTSVDQTSWTRLQDKSLYDVRFLTTGQYGGIDANMLACAAKRGDCIALVDLKEYDLTNNESVSFNYTASNVRSLVDSVSNGEYGAVFTPWFKTKSSDLVVSGTEAIIPASFGYLFAYAKSIKNNPEWYAVAGTTRGVIEELSDTLHNYTEADCEILQARSKTIAVELDGEGDNVGIAINPIALVDGRHVIWGNRTLTNNTGDLKASAFLNVRNMVSAIKKSLYRAAKRLTFEPNSDILWFNFKGLVEPLLTRIQSENGIYSYRLERIATTKKARMKARLTIIPIEAVEDFELEVRLTDELEILE